MKNYSYYFIIFPVIVISFITYNYNNLRQQLDDYAYKKAQRECGSMPLATHQEEKIKNIAKQMGITESITIRKMNHTALAQFGYHNAFAYFPLFLSIIPLSNKPFLFVSEGFFEDLSPEEQLFLIGHEMVHIQKRHTLYLNLVVWILCIFLLVLWWFLRKYIGVFIQYFVNIKYRIPLQIFLSGALCSLCIAIPELIGLAYRRHIEREADMISLEKLDSYDGCIKLMKRWEQDFGLPHYNLYYGLFSDHPSCLERRIYCLELKNKTREYYEQISKT